MAISDVIHRSLTGILDTFFLLTLKKQDAKLTLARSMEFYKKKCHGITWKESLLTFHNWKQKVRFFQQLMASASSALAWGSDAFGVCLVSGSFA